MKLRHLLYSGLLFSGLLNAAIIDTTPGWSGDVVGLANYAIPNSSLDQSTTRFGQTFSSVSGGSLNSFAFYIGGFAGPITYNANLALWNDDQTMGDILFSSPYSSTEAGMTALAPVAFSVNQSLVPGQQYVAYLDTANTTESADFALAALGANFTPAGNTYDGAAVVYDSLSQSWFSAFGPQEHFVFQASIDASAVPEPSPVAFLLVGSTLIALAVVHRQKKAAAEAA